MIAYEALAQSLTARQLQTDLTEAEFVNWFESPHEAADRLASLSFDQAPVTREGILVGFVVQRELVDSSRVNLATHIHRIGPDTLTSAAASIREVMEALLPNAAMTFVVDGHEISGFVTPSDLNKHPARAHFYLLLADLEVALGARIRQAFGDQAEALALLLPTSQGVVEKRFRADQESSLETDLVAGMDLSHLIRIVGLTPHLRIGFGATDEEMWSAWTSGFRGLRNAVMHPTLEFLGASRSLVNLVTAEARIRALLRASMAHDQV